MKSFWLFFKADWPVWVCIYLFNISFSAWRHDFVMPLDIVIASLLGTTIGLFLVHKYSYLLDRAYNFTMRKYREWRNKS